MGFNVNCSPGKNAAAEFMRITAELPALVIYLDPVNMIIQLPSIPEGPQVLARFCRELARAAVKLADEVDPMTAAAGDGTRHLLRGESDGD